MLLFKTIIESLKDKTPGEYIDFARYDLSELSPISTADTSPALSNGPNEVDRFLADAPEIIARNIAYSYKQGSQEKPMIQLRTFRTIDKVANDSDKELSLIFLSLLIHASKFEIDVFQSYVTEISLCEYRRANADELPAQNVVDGALAILKTDPFVQVFTDILNASLGNESLVSRSYTLQQIDKCQIVFVVFSASPSVKGWATVNGVAINVRALFTTVYETLSHRVALACLLGHLIQDYLGGFENFNVSTPELIKSKQNSQAAQKLQLNFPEDLESGVLFEYAAFGGKFFFSAGLSMPLLHELEQRLSKTPVSLPLIREDEKDKDWIRPYLSPNFNLPFGFEPNRRLKNEEIAYE